MEVLHNRRASYTEAYTLLAEAWNSMVQAGQTPLFKGVPAFAGDHEVLYVLAEEGDVIGALTYEASRDSAVYTVSMAYVEHSSRKRGVFRAMLNSLRLRAAGANVHYVICDLHVTNTDSLKTFSKLGAKHVSTTLSFDVFE